MSVDGSNAGSTINASTSVFSSIVYRTSGASARSDTYVSPPASLAATPGGTASLARRRSASGTSTSPSRSTTKQSPSSTPSIVNANGIASAATRAAVAGASTGEAARAGIATSASASASAVLRTTSVRRNRKRLRRRASVQVRRDRHRPRTGTCGARHVRREVAPRVRQDGAAVDGRRKRRFAGRAVAGDDDRTQRARARFRRSSASSKLCRPASAERRMTSRALRRPAERRRPDACAS